jgi:cobaltochelatase CobS
MFNHSNTFKLAPDQCDIRTLFKIAAACGVTGDHGRIYSPAKVGGDLRSNVIKACFDKLKSQCDCPCSHDDDTFCDECSDNVNGAMSRHIQNTPAVAAPSERTQATAQRKRTDATLADALAELLGNAADPENIRAVVREELEKLAPRSIDITCNGATVNTLPAAHRHAVFEPVLRYVNMRPSGGRRQHVMLVGPSGSGKSHLAAQIAEALNLPYAYTGAVSTPFQLIGFVSPNGNSTTLRTPLRMAWEFGGVFGWDEFDASDAKAINSFNGMMDSGVAAFPDKMVTRHTDFVCIASANTWGTGATAEYVGRNRLDNATLQRFIRVEMPYDETLERDLAGAAGAEWVRRVQSIRRAVIEVGVKVLVTPRATLQGCAMLAAGFTLQQAEAATVFAGLDTDTVEKIKEAARA